MRGQIVPCPICTKPARISTWGIQNGCATIEFDCGHKITTKVETFKPIAPPAPQLIFTEFDKFETKIQGSGNKDLVDYHRTTRYRVDVADYCLKLLLTNYDNSIGFAAGLTGFLVQSKSALDSLCEEINQYYNLNINVPAGHAVDSERLIKRIGLLKTKNQALASLLQQELGLGSSWFNDFKDFRDREGTHRTRSPRNLVFGKPQEIEVEIAGKKVALGPYCVDIMQTINRVLENAYKLM